ncbi:UNVERIFIED_ORG: hypothetical protein Xoosp15_64 [Xanthomonas phage Xoo-sp15]
MTRYRKKPVIVEATQWFEGMQVDGVMDKAMLSEVWLDKTSSDGRYVIPTLEGYMTVSNGDYIVTGVKNEKYPVKPDIFEEIYERVED